MDVNFRAVGPLVLQPKDIVDPKRHCLTLGREITYFEFFDDLREDFVLFHFEDCASLSVISNWGQSVEDFLIRTHFVFVRFAATKNKYNFTWRRWNCAVQSFPPEPKLIKYLCVVGQGLSISTMSCNPKRIFSDTLHILKVSC